MSEKLCDTLVVQLKGYRSFQSEQQNTFVFSCLVSIFHTEYHHEVQVRFSRAFDEGDYLAISASVRLRCKEGKKLYKCNYVPLQVAEHTEFMSERCKGHCMPLCLAESLVLRVCIFAETVWHTN